MTSTTPNLGLILYDDSTDLTATFASFRANVTGPASSNMLTIDTYVGDLSTLVDNTKGAFYILATGTDTYSGSHTYITAYSTGLMIAVSFANTNTTTSTINISSIGVAGLKKVNSTGSVINLIAGDLVKNRIYFFVYDGTQFVWVGATSSDQIMIQSGTTGDAVVLAADKSLTSTTQSALISGTIHAAASKTTPVDADELGIWNSVGSVLGRLTWANLKATVKAYADTLYLALVAPGTSGNILTSNGSSWTSTLPKASASDVNTGTNDVLFATAKAIADSNNVPSVSPSTFDRVMTSNGTDWVSSDFVMDHFPPVGTLLNGYILPEIVSSTSLKLSLKSRNGAGDPSSTNPVYIRVSSTVVKVVGALSVTLAAGTNWFNCGSVELAANEADFFAYIGYNSTDGVTIGFSRIPYGTSYSSFSTVNTNEKYCAISTITNAASTDRYVNIGRFAATLSNAAGGHAWTVPSFTGANLIQRPCFETRWLSWTPQYSGRLSLTYTAVTTEVAKYKICEENELRWKMKSVGTLGGVADYQLFTTLPFNDAGASISNTIGFGNTAQVAAKVFSYSSTPNSIVISKYDNSNYATSGSCFNNLEGFYEI